MPGAEPEQECRSSYTSHATPAGMVEYEVGGAITVDGKPGEGWKVIIAYEPVDVYSVYLWRLPTRAEFSEGLQGAVLAERRDVYCDELKGAVESMYDDAIRARCDGWITC